jgi:outer membrane receptor for ferrienterochelin and colicins
VTIRAHALLALVPLASALAAQGPAAAITGVVTDSETRRPLDGALVFLTGTQLRAITRESGQYRLSGIAPGRYAVRVTLIGHQSAEQENVVLDSGEVRQLSFTLARALIDLPGIVVTASRAEERPGDSPASVAVLTRDAVVRRNAITIDQALPFVPGVIFNNGQVDIRGASGVAGGVGSRVLMLLDGHPILTADGGEVDFNAVPMLDLDRVEIVKGAYSALYGSNALGGVVNTITTPIGPAPETIVAAHVGSYDTPADVRYTSAPLGTEDIDVQHSQRFGALGARVAARREHSDGFEEDGWLDRWMVRTKLTWPADDPHASSAYAMVTSEDDGNHFVWRSPAEPYAVNDTTSADWSRAQKIILGATLNPLTTASALLQVSPYVFYNSLQNHFRAGSDSTDYHRATRIGVNVQLALNPWRTHAFTFGGEVSRTWVISNFLGKPVLDDDALYAQDRIAFSERLTGSLGARLDYHDATGGTAAYALSPKLGLVFKPVASVSTRAWIGRGFRAPAAIEQFVSTTMSGFRVVPDSSLQPETAWSGEVGATATVGGWLWLDGALFDSEYHDLIGPGLAPSPPNPPLTFQFKNTERARVRGLDAGVKLALLRGLIGLEASYTYLDAVALTSPGGPLPYRSRHNVTGSVSGLGGLVGVDVRYRSRVDTVLAYPGDPRGSITIVDLRLGYRVLGTIVQAKVANLLQAAYVDVMEKNRGAPRSFLVTAYRTM